MISIMAVLAFMFLILTESDAATLQVLSFFILALIARGLAVWVRSCFIALEQTTWIPRYEVTFRSLFGPKEAAGSRSAWWLEFGRIT